MWDPRINQWFLLSFLPSSLPIHPPVVTETHKRKWISGTRSGEEDTLLAASCYAWLELDGHTWPSKQALFIHLLPHSGVFFSPLLPPPCLLAACRGRVEKRPQCCAEQAVAGPREATLLLTHEAVNPSSPSTGWAFPSAVLLVHRCGCCNWAAPSFPLSAALGASEGDLICCCPYFPGAGACPQPTVPFTLRYLIAKVKLSRGEIGIWISQIEGIILVSMLCSKNGAGNSMWNKRSFHFAGNTSKMWPVGQEQKRSKSIGMVSFISPSKRNCSSGSKI